MKEWNRRKQVAVAYVGFFGEVMEDVEKKCDSEGRHEIINLKVV